MQNSYGNTQNDELLSGHLNQIKINIDKLKELNQNPESKIHFDSRGFEFNIQFEVSQSIILFKEKLGKEYQIIFLNGINGFLIWDNSDNKILTIDEKINISKSLNKELEHAMQNDLIFLNILEQLTKDTSISLEESSIIHEIDQEVSAIIDVGREIKPIKPDFDSEFEIYTRANEPKSFNRLTIQENFDQKISTFFDNLISTYPDETVNQVVACKTKIEFEKGYIWYSQAISQKRVEFLLSDQDCENCFIITKHANNKIDVAIKQDQEAKEIADEQGQEIKKEPEISIEQKNQILEFLNSLIPNTQSSIFSSNIYSQMSSFQYGPQKYDSERLKRDFLEQVKHIYIPFPFEANGLNLLIYNSENEEGLIENNDFEILNQSSQNLTGKSFVDAVFMFSQLLGLDLIKENYSPKPSSGNKKKLISVDVSTSHDQSVDDQAKTLIDFEAQAIEPRRASGSPSFNEYESLTREKTPKRSSSPSSSVQLSDIEGKKRHLGNDKSPS